MLSQRCAYYVLVAVLLWATPVTIGPALAADNEVREATTPFTSYVLGPDKNWGGLSVDLGLYRPLDSRVSWHTDRFNLEFNLTGLSQVSNLTGIHLAAAAAYLFQEGHFVLGPRVRVSGGSIEAMPLDYTIRTNAILTFGGEGGVAVGRWYAYGFGSGGAAWLSAGRTGVSQANNIVSAYELGTGFPYALSQRSYAKAEIAYTTLGDQRLETDYFDAKAYLAFTVGFGYHFTSN